MLKDIIGSIWRYLSGLLFKLWQSTKSLIYYSLRKSSVLDVSNVTANSQISLLGGKKIQKSILDKHQYEIQDDEYNGDKVYNVRIKNAKR